MLTEHQKLHLNAIITDNTQNKLEPHETKVILAESKGVSIDKYDKYCDKMIEKAQNSLNTDTWDNGNSPSGVHDEYEKDPNWENEQ